MDYKSLFEGAEMAIICAGYFMIAFLSFIFVYAFSEYLIMKSRGE